MSKSPHHHPKHLYQETEVPAARTRPKKTGGWFRLRLPPWPVLAAATAVLVYLLAAYLLAHGHELPRWVQLLTGLGFVALAIAAFVVITRARELPGDMLRRLPRRNTRTSASNSARPRTNCRGACGCR